MSWRPRLLDLFCGAGGCAMGYHRAGFEVFGVDHHSQPRYPFDYCWGDALMYLEDHGEEFDVIHASPPCQRYSVTRTIHRGSEDNHPDLVGPTRERLMATGKPWIIENVSGAPLNVAVMLCGTHFGLKVIRHRYFESNLLLLGPSQPCRHPPRGSVVQTGLPVCEGQFMTVAGHFSNVAVARKAMGIDWMNRDELAQAIPPAYTEYLGKQLLAILRMAS